mmetsp:Transcript_36195/g.64779  ORF Transcript_36195/g.64779 Transcript_36195/m.64779 type:complete len:218 (-) Transcript_36195:884-1537(-)
MLRDWDTCADLWAVMYRPLTPLDLCFKWQSEAQVRKVCPLLCQSCRFSICCRQCCRSSTRPWQKSVEPEGLSVISDDACRSSARARSKSPALARALALAMASVARSRLSWRSRASGAGGWGPATSGRQTAASTPATTGRCVNTLKYRSSHRRAVAGSGLGAVAGSCRVSRTSRCSPLYRSGILTLAWVRSALISCGYAVLSLWIVVPGAPTAVSTTF